MLDVKQYRHRNGILNPPEYLWADDEYFDPAEDSAEYSETALQSVLPSGGAL